MFRILLALAAVSFLAGCVSDEERAARHLESGQALFEAGDVARATVEFRSALRLDPNNLDARVMFARAELARGNVGAGLASYARAVEQAPDLLEGHLILGRYAARNQRWEDAERHAEAARALAPDDLDVAVLDTVLAYRQALLASDAAARADALARADDLVLERPESLILRTVLVDGRSWEGDLAAAVTHVDAAIAIDPTRQQLHYSKLSILAERGDEAAIEAHLRAMVTQFPDDDEIKATLIGYLVETGKPDSARAFFRSFADPNAPDVAPYVALVRFLERTEGPTAALAELDRTVESSAHPFVLGALRAGLRFDTGAEEAAMAELETLLAGDPPAAMAGNLRVALAQMRVATGGEAAARDLIAAVLEADPENVAALKMQAGWLIEDDDTDRAIALLRRATNAAPEDVDALTLLATAHARAGEHVLARDLMAEAVTVSDAAPEPSLRYAAVLVDEGRLRPAETILVGALRGAPDNVDLLAALGRVYLEEGDFGRARGVLQRLGDIGTDPAEAVRAGLELALLTAEERTDELLNMLEKMTAAGDGDARALALLIRTRLAGGDAAGAIMAAEDAYAAAPDDRDVRITLAATRAATGDLDGAIAEYRAMLADGHDDPAVHRLLASALFGAGDTEAGEAALAAGLAAAPNDPQLLWMNASILERKGDIDGAIAVYETLYEADSSSQIVANNLASLLATWRSDDSAAVDRAYSIARRLRDTDVPAFQDTFGWLLHLRGESEAALSYLSAAAEALSGDAIVQYHYGMALAGAGRAEAAIVQLEHALGVAGDGDRRPQFDRARAEIHRLRESSEVETTPEN